MKKQFLSGLGLLLLTTSQLATAALPNNFTCTGHDSGTKVRLLLNQTLNPNVFVKKEGLTYRLQKEIKTGIYGPGTRLSGATYVFVKMDDNGGVVRLTVDSPTSWGWMQFQLPNGPVNEEINCTSK